MNRILEDSLPSHLKKLDSTLPASHSLAPPPPPPPVGEQSKAEGDSYLDQREGVFDNDEFDVLRRPGAVDLSRVHVGKK